MYCKDEKPDDYPGSEAIHNRGFFIGVHQVRVEDEKITKLVSLMLDFDFSAGKTDGARDRSRSPRKS